MHEVSLLCSDRSWSLGVWRGCADARVPARPWWLCRHTGHHGSQQRDRLSWRQPQRELRRWLKPNHGLIRFDNLFGTLPGQIQTGDTITSATLRVYVDNPGSGMAVHDMLAPWSQGSVTWNSLVGGVQTDGVEASLSPIASFGANTTAENVSVGWLSINVTSSLVAAQSGALPGFGWALLPFAAGTNGIDFHTSEFVLDAALRPELSVAVTPVPEPAAWLLMALGAAGLAARRGRA